MIKRIFKKIKNKLSALIFIGFLSSAAIILFSKPYQINGDAWYHLKAGEIYLRNGLLFKDIFSFTAYGREWLPYEWLFQVIIYLITKSFGFLGLKIFTYLWGLIQISIVYLLCQKIFKLNTLLSIVVCIVFFSWNFVFITDRPYVMAYAFFLINLSLLLLYFLRSKNLLLLTLPITWLWANSHGSIFIDIFLFISYAGVALFNFLIFKDRVWRKKFVALTSLSIISVILTILPPLGITQYRLLFLFSGNMEILTNMFDEYMSIAISSNMFILLAAFSVGISILFFLINFKRKTVLKSLWSLPLIILVLFSFTAVRNTFFTFSALVVLLAWIFSNINFSTLKINNKVLVFTAFVGLVFLNFCIFYYFLGFFEPAPKPPYPDGAIKFIQKYNLKGNMYNELAYGGYLIYKLYPQRKVFIDLRGDVYLCCELKDYYSLIQNKYQPDTKYKNLLDNLWNKYNISYAILDSTENTVQSRIGKTLINDPNWNLVFWDDNSQIFIKNDRKNTNLLTLFSAKAASPYDTTPIRKNNLDLALQEYRRMISIADSARSRNAIGYILFKEGKMDQAQAQFQKALQLNNNYDSPYMNLGELFLLKKDTYTAIKLYQKALSLNPGRAFIYIRLGELYLRNGESGHAKQVWQKGLDNIQEATAQRTFKQLLQSVY